ncbi:MAG: hypothetical protein QF411_07070, partial [Planctomycetota bacterium]|nr:hypothetical protein [Planctomycetota bacterium]
SRLLICLLSLLVLAAVVLIREDPSGQKGEPPAGPMAPASMPAVVLEKDVGGSELAGVATHQGERGPAREDVEGEVSRAEDSEASGGSDADDAALSEALAAEFRNKYAGMPVPDIVRARNILLETFDADVSAAVDLMIASGESIGVPDKGGSFKGGGAPVGAVQFTRWIKRGAEYERHHITLTRATHPHLFRAKDEANWIRDHLNPGD